MFRSLVRAFAPTLRARITPLFRATEGSPEMAVDALEGRLLMSAAHPKGSRNGAVATPQTAVVVPASTRASRARARARARATGANAAPPSNIAYDGPIVITQGGTYSGNWQSLDPNVPAVTILTSQPVVIQNSNIRSRGTLIDAYHETAVNLTVRNTSGFGLNPNVTGVQGGRFLNVSGFTNVDVEHCYLEGTCGIYLEEYVGNHTASQTFTIKDNVARNIDGRLSDGNGGYLSTPADHYVQFFQTNGLHNIVGAEVAWNQVTNLPGQSLVEDNISIFDTTGTRKNRILIHDNFIDGAYPIDAAHDTDYTGGGIMLSDLGGAFVSAYNNQIVDTTNYGVAISSGHDNAIYNNRIISSGELADGTPVVTQNVGCYIWNQNDESGFSNNVGYGNVIAWTGKGGNNDSWTPDAAKWTGNNEMDSTVTPAATQAEFTAWLGKLAKSSISVGVAS